MNRFAITSLITLITLFSIPSQAELICKWTAQGTDVNFASDEIFSKKPTLEKENCGTNGTPTCTGYIYCSDNKTGTPAAPPEAGFAACEAVKVEGKWRCPDAQTCHDDVNVIVSNLPRIPSKAAAAPAGASDGGAVREGTK